MIRIQQDKQPLIVVLSRYRDPHDLSRRYRRLVDGRHIVEGYATELAHGRVTFPSGTEGRIERLRFKVGLDAGLEGIRFSWWKDGRMIPRPLDATEEELLTLFKDSLQHGVFSEGFQVELRKLLGKD